MDEDRIALESRIAFLEKTCDDLNDAVVGQQQTILRLEQGMQQLQAQLEAMRLEQERAPTTDEPPPHY